MVAPTDAMAGTPPVNNVWFRMREGVVATGMENPTIPAAAEPWLCGCWRRLQAFERGIHGTGGGSPEAPGYRRKSKIRPDL
jgi:hypothetical protein